MAKIAIVEGHEKNKVGLSQTMEGFERSVVEPDSRSTCSDAPRSQVLPHLPPAQLDKERGRRKLNFTSGQK